MKDITKQEFDAIIKLSPEERYVYFIKRICDWEQIWTLYSDDNLVLNEDKKGKLEVFLFPYETFVSYYAHGTKSMEEAVGKCFHLDEFMGKVMEKLLSHDVNMALVFPVANAYGLKVTMKKLINDINEELENYK
ncbi:MAG: DUF2750 domain-containing protein [Prevotella sp.]|nr:DUF2750 domain-containing protein [Prevotella sp.]